MMNMSEMPETTMPAMGVPEMGVPERGMAEVGMAEMSMADIPLSGLESLMARGTGSFCPDPRFAPEPVPTHASPAFVAQLTRRMVRRDPLAEARAQAYAQGLADGRAAAEAEAVAHAAADAAELARGAAARERLSLAFTRLDASLTERLAEQLTETVAVLCEATLAPLALDRTLLAARARRAAAMFARADDVRVIRLNPEDLAATAPLLPEGWHFRPDATLAPGALRVETPSGGAEDGPAQWGRAIRECLDPAFGK